MLGVDNADLAAQLEAANIGWQEAKQDVQDGKVSVQSLTVWIVALTLTLIVVIGIGFGVWRWYYCRFKKGLDKKISSIEGTLSEGRSMFSDSSSMNISNFHSVSDMLDPENGKERFQTDLSSIEESGSLHSKSRDAEIETLTANAMIHEHPETITNQEYPTKEDNGDTVDQQEHISSAEPNDQGSTISTDSTSSGQSDQINHTIQAATGEETVREVSEITVM